MSERLKSTFYIRLPIPSDFLWPRFKNIFYCHTIHDTHLTRNKAFYLILTAIVIKFQQVDENINNKTLETIKDLEQPSYGQSVIRFITSHEKLQTHGYQINKAV